MKDGKKGGKKPSWGEEGRDNNAGSETQKRKQKTESNYSKTFRGFFRDGCGRRVARSGWLAGKTPASFGALKREGDTAFARFPFDAVSASSLIVLEDIPEAAY
ncbi:unnamed protein product [Caretta caretta]